MNVKEVIKSTKKAINFFKKVPVSESCLIFFSVLNLACLYLLIHNHCYRDALVIVSLMAFVGIGVFSFFIIFDNPATEKDKKRNKKKTSQKE